MNGDEESKLFYYNTHNISFCHACLSSDRILLSIGENVDLYRKICSYPHEVSISQILLCWECMAVLKKIRLFKTKVIEAQRILGYNCMNKQDQLQLNSLSKLTTTTLEDTIFVTHEDEEIKPIEVKQEIDIPENEYTDNYQELDNYTYLDEIKKEIIEKDHKRKQKIKNHIENAKSKNYRLTYGVPKEVLRRKVKIKLNEVNFWMEKERDNEFYKNFRYKCKECIYGWNYREKLKEHNQKYHLKTIGSYTCDICTSRFSAKPALRTHLARHYHAEECTRCGYRCYTARVMSRHLDGHRDVVQCVYCDQQTQSLSAFYKHFKSTHGVFLCDHCGKRCKSKHMMERHIRRHFETYECKMCNKRYKTAATLRKHTDMKHVTVRTEEAYCVLCDRQFDNATVFKRHVQTSAAHAHERDASIKKKVPCPDCGNVYSRKTYMMNHYRHVHMNQSKHYCEQCDRHFLNRTRYVEHTRYYHEGVKKEKNKLCNICGRGFAANRTLVNHIRTHSGERPHACAHCGGQFTQRHAMLAHVRRVHPPHPHPPARAQLHMHTL